MALYDPGARGGWASFRLSPSGCQAPLELWRECGKIRGVIVRVRIKCVQTNRVALATFPAMPQSARLARSGTGSLVTC